jgi:hypothetical protein
VVVFLMLSLLIVSGDATAIRKLQGSVLKLSMA